MLAHRHTLADSLPRAGQFIPAWYAVLHHRLVVALGSLCCVCGYLGMYLMVAGLAPKNFVQLLIFAAAAGASHDRQCSSSHARQGVAQNSSGQFTASSTTCTGRAGGTCSAHTRRLCQQLPPYAFSS